MNHHRNIPSVHRRESKAAVLQCQSPGNPGPPGVFGAETGEVNSRRQPSIVPQSATSGNEGGSTPSVVGRTPYDLISENPGGLSSALAEFVRSVNPVVLLLTVAFVLLGIFGKPPGL